MVKNHMKTCPLITTIVPAFNAEKTIGNTIEQLLNQNYRNLQIICVDDGSTDNTKKIIENFEKYGVILISKKNGGVSSARNAGLDFAKGKYITFVDSGDIVDREFVSYLYGLISESNCQLGICSRKYMSADGISLDARKYCLPIEEEHYFSQEEALSELIKDYGMFNGYVWDKIYINDLIGDLRFDKRIHNCEDTLFNFYYLKKCNRVILGSEAHYCYVMDLDSVTRGKYSRKYFSSFLAWETIYKELNDKTQKKQLEMKISNDILIHEVKAWRTLNHNEKKQYKKDFSTLSRKYRKMSGLKNKIYRIGIDALWKLV